MDTPPPLGGFNPAMELRARLRPMGIGDILDETFRLYRANALLFVATVAVVEVPMQIISVIITLAFNASAQSVTNLSPSANITQSQINTLLDASRAAGVSAFLNSLVSFAGLIIMSAALAVVISHRYLDRPITVGAAYRAALNRFGHLVVAILWLLVRIVLLVLASFVLIGIPFLIYFGVAWSLVAQVIMLEGVPGSAATRRSRELVRGYWWKTLGVVVAAAVLVFIIGGIPSAIVGAIIGVTTGTTTRTIITAIVGLAAGMLVRPIQAAATTLLFYDLKIRKEAFDLEALAEQAGLPAPPPAAWP